MPSDITIEPAFVSKDDAARYIGGSIWQVEELLRRGVLKAKKSGRRTLVVFESVKAHAASLPDAEFGPSRRSPKAA